MFIDFIGFILEGPETEGNKSLWTEFIKLEKLSFKLEKKEAILFLSYPLPVFPIELSVSQLISTDPNKLIPLRGWPVLLQTPV